MKSFFHHAYQIALCAFVSATAVADDLPTVDLQKGTSYPELRKSGVTIREGKHYREGARSSDAILDKSLRVFVAPGKAFTLQSEQKTAMVGVSADESTIEFFSFSGAYPTPDATKEKLREIGLVLGFDAKEFEAAIDGKRPGWTALGDSKAPFWAVELNCPGLPTVPYEIHVVFTWDVPALKKLAGKAFFIRDMQKK